MKGYRVKQTAPYFRFSGALQSYGSCMLMTSSSCWPCIGVASLLQLRGLVGICWWSCWLAAILTLIACSWVDSYDSSRLSEMDLLVLGSSSMSILSWYGVMRPEEAREDSLEEWAEREGFLPLASELIAGGTLCWMSIPKSFVVDIGGRGEVLRFESVLRELKRVKNENLFADFPIGATMQDGGKRKRSAAMGLTLFWQRK